MWVRAVCVFNGVATLWEGRGGWKWPCIMHANISLLGSAWTALSVCIICLSVCLHAACRMTVSATVALSMVASITTARIAAGLRLPLECVTKIEGHVAANDSTASRSLHASSVVDPRPGAHGAALQAEASDPGPRGAQAVPDEAMVTVSFMISPAVNRSGTTSEAIVSSLMAMTDGAQPLWAQPPGVVRVPGVTTVSAWEWAVAALFWCKWWSPECFWSAETKNTV